MRGVGEGSRSLLDRLNRYYECGAVAGKLFCLIVVLDFVLWKILTLLIPAPAIAARFDRERFKRILLEEEKGKV